MSQWPSARARRVLAALFRTGWSIKRQTGSHRTLSRQGWPDFVFAFHDDEELGPLNRSLRQSRNQVWLGRLVQQTWDDIRIHCREWYNPFVPNGWVHYFRTPDITVAVC